MADGAAQAGEETPSRSRRAVLRAGGAGLLTMSAISVASCDLLSTGPRGGEGDAGHERPATGPGESPVLAGQVRAGKLPPVGKRLPKSPLVVEPTAAAGQYGGTWHSWIQGLGSTFTFSIEIGYDDLVRWDPNWTKVIPNLAASWDVGREGREYTFHLRERARWSDGELFTADDLIFAYEDVLKNTDLYPVGPSQFVIDEKMADLEKLDDYTVRFTFGKPSGLFLEQLAAPIGGVLLKPRHYLERFHKSYNKDVEILRKEEKFGRWEDLFFAKSDPWANPELPVLNAWRVVKPLAKGSGRASFERNAYYWKVDRAGAQLPYLDGVSYQLIQDLEVVVLNTAQGEIDFNYPLPWSGVCALANKPVLARGRDKGDFHFVDGVSGADNRVVICLNLAHKDAKLREVFQDRDFRIGLSYAINRQELVDAVYQRQGEPWQAAPRRGSSFYIEELAKQYSEYDVRAANTHLDRAGYATRDESGFRLHGDGRRIGFAVDVATETPAEALTMERVAAYWKEVGVDMRVKSMDRTLFYERKAGNLHDANVWIGEGGSRYAALLDPRYYFPFSGESNWAIPWATWYNSHGTDGEEPPPAAQEQMDLYDQVKVTIDERRRRELFLRLLEIAREQFWVIGTVLDVGLYGTVKNTFHNVPRSMPAEWMYPTPGPTRPEQYFTSEG